MAERQSEHRQTLEKRVVWSDTRNEAIGQVLAFIIAMTTIVGGILLAWQDKSAVGLTILLSGLTTLVGIFIYGRWRKERELAEKRKAFGDQGS